MHFFGDFEHVFWRSSLYSLENFTNFCGGSEAVRHLEITVSVICLSVRPSVRPSVWASARLSHFSSDYNFATVHVSHCIPCDMTFLWYHNFWPRDLHLELWPAFVKTRRDKVLIYHMYVSCERTFHMVPFFFTLTLNCDLLLKNFQTKRDRVFILHMSFLQDLSHGTINIDLVTLTLNFDLLLKKKTLHLWHSFQTRKDRAFVLHMCIPCDKTLTITNS